MKTIQMIETDGFNRWHGSFNANEEQLLLNATPGQKIQLVKRHAKLDSQDTLSISWDRPDTPKTVHLSYSIFCKLLNEADVEKDDYEDE